MQLLECEAYPQPRPCVCNKGQSFAKSFSWPQHFTSLDTAHFFSKSSLSARLLTNIPDKTNETKMNYLGLDMKLVSLFLVPAPKCLCYYYLHSLKVPIFQNSLCLLGFYIFFCSVFRWMHHIMTYLL